MTFRDSGTKVEFHQLPTGTQLAWACADAAMQDVGYQVSIRTVLNGSEVIVRLDGKAIQLKPFVVEPVLVENARLNHRV